MLRHGGLWKLFTAIYTPSTLGSILRTFTFGHIRQLDAVASRFLRNLTEEGPLLVPDAGDGYLFLDVGDTIIQVHGHQKQGSGHGYSGVRGINAILATATTNVSAPDIIGHRLRRGACGSPLGAKRLIRDSLGHPLPPARDARRPGAGPGRLRFLWSHDNRRRDQRWRGRFRDGPDGPGDQTSHRDDPRAGVGGHRIHRRHLRRRDETVDLQRGGRRGPVHRVQVEEHKRAHHPASGRQAHPGAEQENLDQPALLDTHRFHAFFTTGTSDTVTADKIHRGHAIIEQVHADLKNRALSHLPSGVFTANAAWLVLAVIAFNLTCAAATIAGTGLAKATTATIRRKLVSIPARIASSARRLTLNLPKDWPWETACTALFASTCGPPNSATT